VATYSLSGTGIQTLTADTTSIYLTITTLPIGTEAGAAHPLDYYDVGQIRLGDATGFFDAIVVVGGPQWIGLPIGCTRVGYAFGDAVVSLQEVVGGTRPFCCETTGGGNGGSTAYTSEVLVTTAVASVTLPPTGTLPQTYRNARIVFQARGSNASQTVALMLRFNGDATNVYDYSLFFGLLGANASQQAAQPYIMVAELSGNTAPANTSGSGEILVPNYSGTTFRKQTSTRAFDKKGDSTNNFATWINGGEWRNTSAVTSITLLPNVGNFMAGSLFRLSLE
jgi:hypothetical protein